ncbi:MAG: DUF3325 family protein [Pseudomonadota bacterium]
MAVTSALILTLMASICLCIAMRRHRALLGGYTLSRFQTLSLRTLGFLLLTAAMILFFYNLDFMPAIALFFGWFTVTIVLIALTHTAVVQRR